jgi:hypothetical protein
MSFTQLVGASDQDRGDGKVSAVVKPVDRRVVTQQWVDFSWLVPGSMYFDAFKRPTRVTRSSSLNPDGTGGSEVEICCDDRALPSRNTHVANPIQTIFACPPLLS